MNISHWAVNIIDVLCRLPACPVQVFPFFPSRHPDPPVRAVVSIRMYRKDRSGTRTEVHRSQKPQRCNWCSDHRGCSYAAKSSKVLKEAELYLLFLSFYTSDWSSRSWRTHGLFLFMIWNIITANSCDKNNLSASTLFWIHNCGSL